MRNRRNRGFTLVEILIVVVILGILAAVVVPQFTNASDEAQASNVDTQLQTVQSQIALYQSKNAGSFPDFGANGWDDMVGQGLLKAAPVNPRTNSSTIAVAAADPQDTAIGWWWDAANGDMHAVFYNDDWRTDGTNDPWTNN